MLASCQGSDATPPVPAHCGARRGNKPLPVTPFMPDCGDYDVPDAEGRLSPYCFAIKQVLLRNA
jgi:hypothetical protein